MNGIDIQLAGDGCWPDLAQKQAELQWLHGTPQNLSFARLDMGMQSGRSSVAIRVNLPDGRVVVAETSMALFLGCADAFRALEQRNAEVGKGLPS